MFGVEQVVSLQLSEAQSTDSATGQIFGSTLLSPQHMPGALTKHNKSSAHILGLPRVCSVADASGCTFLQGYQLCRW